MPSLSTVESLQASLEPLESLRGEQSQLETWVNDSFQALENLHSELAEWQSDLARKQTELDLREDTLEKCRVEEHDIGEKVGQWKKELAQARVELRQLEEENAEQLQDLEKLECRQAILETELKVATTRTEEISATLASERAATADEQQQWRVEFQKIRLLLEKQCNLLAHHLGEVEELQDEETLDVPVDLETASRNAILRRRAQSRRAAKNRKQRDDKDSSPT